MKTYKPSDIFKSSKFHYRDSDIDNWLPKKMPVLKDGTVTKYDIKQNQTFMDMFKDNGLTEETAKAHVFSLQQIEKMIENEDEMLQKNGYGNFFLVQGEKEIFVLCATRRRCGDWYASVHRLDHSRVWSAGLRLLLRNYSSDTSVPLTLGHTCPHCKKELEVVIKTK